MDKPERLDRRDEIIALVANGMMMPETAEDLARKEGLGSLSQQPEGDAADPLKEQDWTLPMAILWIAARTPDAVRLAWNGFLEQCWEWAIRRPQPDLPGTIYTAHDLRPREHFKLRSLATCVAARGGHEPVVGFSMSTEAANDALWSALRNAAVDATGFDATTGDHVKIGAMEWNALEFDDRSDGEDVLIATGPAAGKVVFKSVRVPCRSIAGMWSAPRVEPVPLLPPLMRPDGHGFMPAYCAAQWIATQGGALTFDPRDVSIWRPAYRALLDHVSTGAIAMSGVRHNERERVDGIVFAGCDIDYPFQEVSIDLIMSDAPCLVSYPYLDEKSWRNGLDDSFRSRRKNEWSALMVSKPDVARCFPFEAARPMTSGTPGRPTSMHMVLAELKSRKEAGRLEPTLRRQAASLAEWLATVHPAAPKAGIDAIENGIRMAYRQAKIP